MQRFVLGLGSNLGAREENLRRAVRALGERYALLAASSLYHSAALLTENAPESWDLPFINQVLLLQGKDSPEQVLGYCQQLEQAMGRQKQGVWSPRVIDIDILDWQGESRASATLAIPHPQAALRDFVLQPWAEIAPEWQLGPHSIRQWIEETNYPPLHKVPA